MRWLALAALALGSLPASSDDSRIVSGTGFFVSADCHLVTNYHVVKDAAAVVVIDHMGERYEAEMVTIDRNNDLSAAGYAA